MNSQYDGEDTYSDNKSDITYWILPKLNQLGTGFVASILFLLTPLTLKTDNAVSTLSSIPSTAPIHNLVSTSTLKRQQNLQSSSRPTVLPKFSIQLSTASALTEDQLLVDDVWKEVTRQYVDRTFNGLGEDGWRAKRLDAVTKVSNTSPGYNGDDIENKEFVYAAIRTMLEPLGDPYTRFLSPEQFQSLTAYAKGGLFQQAGLGIQLMADPAYSGKVVVINTVPNGPADKGGVLPGDVILQVDDLLVADGMSADVVAAKCRGESGSAVQLTVGHSGNDGNKKGPMKIETVSLQRAQVQRKSVESSVFKSAESKGKTIGLLKMSSFNQETENQVLDALKGFKSKKGGTGSSLSAIVIDLRGNAGGYMPAGVNVAKFFLPPQSKIISEVDKSGRATIYTNDGVGSESDTTIPLFVLVDERTASASEILTAALQDNHRATILGTSTTATTFGKGRIQNLQELTDGSGISVTKAKYITPNGRDIHGVGIKPDIKLTSSCQPKDPATVCLENFSFE